MGNGVFLAPGVKLDLGGHRLSGGGGNGTGVTATGSTDNTIVNGTIVDWGQAIAFSGAGAGPDSSLKITNVRIARAPLTIDTAHVAINHSRLNRSPVSIQGSTLTVYRSTLKRSSTSGDATRTLLDHSTVFGGGVGLGENNAVRIRSSHLDGTGYDGRLDLCDISRSIVDSTVRHYSLPLWTHSCPTYVTHSVFAYNPNGALLAETPDDTVISDSTFRDNGAVAVDATFGRLLVDHSTFSRNGTGIRVGGTAVAHVLSTTFVKNTGDGLSAEGTATMLYLADNLAVDNGGYGINVLRARDLGGNRASGNSIGQCIGVVCSP